METRGGKEDRLPEERSHALQPLRQCFHRGGEREPQVFLSFSVVPRAEVGAGEDGDTALVQQALLQLMGVGGANPSARFG
jgi:hypothetical protein